jgi:MEMO1 family protein
MMSAGLSIRPPAVAGGFYPDAPAVLSAMIDGFLADARVEPVAAKAIAVPHAGYVYSGPIAATAYAGVRHLAGQVRRVVLLGPAHRYGFVGIAVPSADGLATPLGVVPVDRAGVDTALTVDGVQTLDRAFDGEHALEVQLPFILRSLPEAAVVPLIVGDATPEQVEAVLTALWGGPETLIVVSTDMSHYHDYRTARRRDLTTAQAIEKAEADAIDGGDACGSRALAGLLRRARALDLRVTARDLRTSGDTAGDKTRVVGYGAFSFEPAESARLSAGDRSTLLKAAREALYQAVSTGKPPAVPVESYPWPLRAVRRTFVTIEIDGALRGCIGSVTPHRPLVEDVVENACRSAIEDPRFAPMHRSEAERSVLTISILSHDRPMTVADNDDLLAQLRPGRDGLILRDGGRAALFLPKVWDMLPDPAEFVAHLKQKAGLPSHYFSASLQAIRFVAETFAENEIALTKT